MILIRSSLDTQYLISYNLYYFPFINIFISYYSCNKKIIDINVFQVHTYRCCCLSGGFLTD